MYHGIRGYAHCNTVKKLLSKLIQGIYENEANLEMMVAWVLK